MEDRLLLYPNPSSGSFTLELNDIEDGTATIELVNSIGQVVYKNKVQVENGRLQKQLELKNTVNGLYVLRVLVQDKIYERKVMVN